MLLSADLYCALDDIVCFQALENRVGIALRPDNGVFEVAAGSHGRVYGQQRGQFLVIDLALFRSFTRCQMRGRDDQKYRLANVVYGAVGQQRLVMD